MSLELVIRHVDGVCVVDVIGHVVMGKTSQALQDMIADLLTKDERSVLLNLDGVTYVDSSGIGELVRSLVTIADRGGKLKLFNVPKRIKDLMRLSGITEKFEVFEDEAKAVASFS
ncbi:MAG TPA: STAS domain-containing protein [Acidobacteriota bacterium]|nr:STAS domain-containing protein [Acidobacteriota bacterium]